MTLDDGWRWSVRFAAALCVLTATAAPAFAGLFS